MSTPKVSPVVLKHTTAHPSGRSWSRSADFAELPYEWLFATASEAVLVVDASSGSVVAANAAAAVRLQSTRPALVGTPLLDAVDAASAHALNRALECASRAGRATPIVVRACNSRMELSATVSLLRRPHGSYWLVRLAANPEARYEVVHEAAGSPVLAAIEGSMVGFLVADAELRVEFANRAFIDMIEAGGLEDLRSQSLQRWLKFTTSDSARLHAQMCQRQAVTVLDTTLRSERGSTRHVEVRAVAVPDEQSACWGFSVCERPPVN